MKDHGKNVNDGKNDNVGSGPHNSPASHNSHSPPDPPPDLLLPPRGDYQTLLSFQKAEVIYDITFRFAHKFLAKSDRTIDQMIQVDAWRAAPSEHQNLEFKEAKTQLDFRKLCKYCLALANEGGGQLEIDKMDRSDRIRACYQHCCLRYVMNQQMNNQSLRQRFSCLKTTYLLKLNLR